VGFWAWISLVGLDELLAKEKVLTIQLSTELQ